MKTLFIVLVVANVLLAAWSLSGSGDSRDAHLVSQQVNAEKIKLLNPREVAQVAAARPPEPPKMASCVEWGPFAASDAARVDEALVPLALGPRLSQRKVDENIGWWVYIPVQPSRQAANLKAGEVKRLGIEDFFVVNEDPKWRNALQFGLFKSEEAARAKLDQLRAKGVKTAQVGKREAQVSKVYFQMRDVPEQFASKLGDMKGMFPGSEVKACGADAAKAPA